MKRFVEGQDRAQSTLFPECLENWIGEDNPVRAIDVFVEELDLADVGFAGVDPEATGRPSYHPSVLLKLYIYGYLNRVQSSRRLEREAGRNVEVMWLTGRLVPDHKTIADFRKDNGSAVRKVCARFVLLCREMGLLTVASVAIDGSKFKAVNNRDKNFTRAKMERRLAQIDESVARYLSQLDTADLQEPSEALAVKTAHLKDKLAKLASEVERLKAIEKEMLASPDQTATMVVCRLGIAEQYHDAIRLARRALCFDPYREELVRKLLILLALDERRCEAIQYYQGWSKSLRAEIDIAPLPATRQVLEEIKSVQNAEGFDALRSRLADPRLEALAHGRS